MRIAIKFAYDGRNFYGYARQPKLKTVEGELLNALMKLGYIKDIKRSQFRSASRTDKGVSALCNVIAFNIEKKTNNIFKELNLELSGIYAYAKLFVNSDFYPRYAKYRCYRYYLKNTGLDIEKVIHAANVFTGEHNFSNFARVEEYKDPIRTIDNITIIKDDDFLIIDFYAQTYLWHQIRRIVAGIQKVGLYKIKIQDIINALKQPAKKFDFGIVTAEPLILKDIIYDLGFEYKKNYLKLLNNLECRVIHSI